MKTVRKEIQAAMQKHCPVKCFFGFDNIEEIMALKKKGEPFLYGDHAYFDRGYDRGNFRIVYNGIHRTNLIDVPADRRDKFKIRLIKWHHGEKILVIPAPKNPLIFHKDNKWNENLIDRLVKLTKREIVIKTDKTNGLGDSIKNCWAVVSHSSVAGVEAAVSGIRVVGPKTSPASPVSVDIEQIENPIEPDRELWLNTLSYSQFAYDEIKSGFAWNTIKETDKL